MEAPISEEFGRVFKETQRGMTLEESMNRMVERTDSDDLDMLCTAIIIQRKVGGNLAEVLEKISGTIQSRISLRKEIKTRTASGQLFETSAGRAMLAFGFVWECIGFAVIKKVVTIKY